VELLFLGFDPVICNEVDEVSWSNARAATLNFLTLYTREIETFCLSEHIPDVPIRQKRMIKGRKFWVFSQLVTLPNRGQYIIYHHYQQQPNPPTAIASVFVFLFSPTSS